MKVTLDLSRLLAQGQITPEEYEKLGRLAAADTGSLGFNILIGTGVVAVGGAALALVPTPITAIVLGAVLMALGLALLVRYPAWLVLANILVLVAALMFSGGVLLLSGGTALAFLGLSAILLVSGAVARSGLLVALGIVAISGALGAATDYSHASYELVIEQPALTILIFLAIALATYSVSMRLGHEAERLCLVAARTALFLVAFGFWIGSLWGDRLTWLRRSTNDASSSETPPMLSDNFFAVVWAVALIGVGIWAVRANRRWTVNLVAVFGAIHFYTQWFEHLSATPLSVLAAGLATLAVAIGLWKWNQHFGSRPGRGGALPPITPGR